ncbi:MAG: fasciclin domain-containing protein [Desulfofustis sp.]|nr:fasciclin domain-containing protein [Desulfofustis sp.]
MKRLIISIACVIFLVPALVIAGGGYKKYSMKTMDVVDMAAHTGQFNTLVAAVQAADLEDVLRGDGPFTILAPNDDAFAKLPAGTVEDLLKPENVDKLKGVLTYHVIPGEVYAKDIASMTSGKTVNGQEVKFKVDGDSVFADAAKIIQTDVKASNGVIHIIDNVILPM